MVRLSPRTAAAALATAVLLIPAQSASAAPATGSPVVDVDACTARDDDEPAVLPFSMDFYGNSYDEVDVARNRSATFTDAPLYAPDVPLADLGTAIITPFYGWATDLTGWGTTTYEGHHAFCATWKDLRPYGWADQHNTFQLLIVEREDRGPGESDIVFNYETLQWGGGRVGFTDGSGRPGSFFELPGPRGPSALDSSPTGLARTSTNSDVLGRHVFATPTQEPAEPPERIYFSSRREGNTDIYSVTPQGTAQRRLTSDPAPDTVPNLSPNGRRIAFDRALSERHEAMTMLTDGTGAYTYGTGGRSTTPTFDPYSSGDRGTRPIFDPYSSDISGFTYSAWPYDDWDGGLDRGPDLVAAFPLNQAIVGVTGLPGTESTPAYSPDGGLLAFTSQQDGQIDVVIRDGDVFDGDPALTTLTPPSMAGFDPTFSPDGSRIVFTGIKDGNVDLWSMTPTGADLRRLTTDPGADATADHSPDGSRIVFSSTRTGKGDLYTIKPDGTDVRQLTNTPAPETEPAW